jgi:hypothetical protein
MRRKVVEAVKEEEGKAAHSGEAAAATAAGRRWAGAA